MNSQRAIYGLFPEGAQKGRTLRPRALGKLRGPGRFAPTPPLPKPNRNGNEVNAVVWGSSRGKRGRRPPESRGGVPL